jgi:putative PIN family toxin of toxin-antitoxin system
MSSLSLPKVTIDTNVIFAGLTKQGGASGLVIDAWLAGLMTVYVSNALAYEYNDVLSRKLSEVRWLELQPVLAELIDRTQYTKIHFSWRPASPDPGDDLVIDCAMNAGAIVITLNIRDFQNAKRSLGLQVMTPTEFINTVLSGE